MSHDTYAGECRVMRQALRMTQGGLAAAMGVSRATVAIMERGVRPHGRPIAEKEWRRYGLMLKGLWSEQHAPGISEQEIGPPGGESNAAIKATEQDP